MNIRRLVADDAEVYRRLRLWGLQESPSAFGSTFSEEIRMSLDTVKGRMGVDNPAESFVLGAYTDAGRLVGVIGCYREGKTKSRHKANIWGMFVAPDHRRQGIGRALLDAAIAEAATMSGLRRLNLSVDTGNVAASALYRSAGFVEYGVEPEAYGADGEFFISAYMTLRLPGDE